MRRLTAKAVDRHECQRALVLLENNYANIRLQHLITIGARFMLVQDGDGVEAASNLNVRSHPAWSQVSVFDPTGNQESHMSPDMATVIPLPHTKVPARATLTMDAGVGLDVVALPYDGNQNAAPGPGKDRCSV